MRSVEKGSRAEKAGFHAGDVIVKVNGESINDSGDFTHALRGRKNNAINVSIIRDKREQNLTLSLPEHNQSQMLDESFEVPEIDAETVIDLSQVESQMARVKPEIERAVRQMRVPNVEEATREVRAHQRRELKQEMRELQRELRDRTTRSFKRIKPRRLAGPSGYIVSFE